MNIGDIVMEFKIVENQYRDYESILDNVAEDYFVMQDKVVDIKKKYNLNNRRWEEVKELLFKHKYSKQYNRESKSKAKTEYCPVRVDTGLYRVTVVRTFNNSQGFVWKYRVNDSKSFNYMDLCELEQVVRNNGLEWRVLNKELAECSYSINEYYKDSSSVYGYKYVSDGVYDLVPLYSRKPSSTGVFYVLYDKKMDNWRFYDKVNNCSYSDKDLRCLRDTVIGKGLDWIILDWKLYVDSMRFNRER